VGIKIAEAETAETDHSPSTVEEWLTVAMSQESPDAAARNLILSAAEKHCTKKQRAALTLLLDGRGVKEIARMMGVSHSTVSRHLYGDAREGHGGGVVAKLRQVMKQEAQLVREALDEVEARDSDASVRNDALAWFSGITPLRVDMFGPLAALLVMSLAADAKRTVSIGDLYLYMPKPIVTAAIPRLKATGYIATDGITITVRKTPLDELRKEKV
jgi:DNA-binding CsgD family transcriptional regulator